MGKLLTANAEIWGLAHVPLDPATVAAGGVTQFEFHIIAPSTPGVYEFRWQMLQENIEWFGARTDIARIAVIPSFEPLGAGTVFSGDPTVVKNKDEQLEVFAHSAGRLVRLRPVYEGAGSAGADPIIGYGSELLTDAIWGSGGRFAAVRRDDGWLDVFGRTRARRYAHLPQFEGRWFLEPLEFAGAENFFTDDPAVGMNSDGRLEVFGVNALHGDLSHSYQIQSTFPWPWSFWQSLSGTPQGTPAVIRPFNLLQVLARFTDGSTWHIEQTEFGGLLYWSGWQPLGGTATGDPAIGELRDGRIAAFVRSGDGLLYYQSQSPLHGWSQHWIPISDLRVGGRGKPAVVTIPGPAGEVLDVYATGVDGAVYHITQLPDESWPTSWESLAGHGLTSDPAVAENHRGELEVFVRGEGNLLWHRRQISPGIWPGIFGDH